MKLINLKKIFCIIFLLNFSAGAQEATTIVVQKGDTISDVLYRLKLIPVYGDKGSLNQILKLNPELKLHGGDLIFPGDVISLEEIISPNYLQNKRVPTVVKEEVVPFLPQEKKSEDYSEFYLTLDSRLISIEGSSDDSTNGHLNSANSTGLRLAWSPRSSGQKIWPEFGTAIYTNKFNNSTTRNLNSRNKTTQQLWLRGYYLISSNLVSSLSFMRGDQIFYRASSADDITIDTVPLNTFSTSLKYTFFRTQNINYGMRAEVSAYLPLREEVYKSELGLGHTFSFIAEHELEKLTFFGDFYYSSDRFPMKEITYKREDVGLRFGVKFKIGLP